MMPEKKWILVKVELDSSEMRVYQKVLIFSQTLFAQFLHQRAEKNQDYMENRFSRQPGKSLLLYYKVYKLVYKVVFAEKEL